MKKVLLFIPKLAILLTTILPALLTVFIIYVTKGRSKCDSEILDDTFKIFDIILKPACLFLGIESIPEIYVSNRKCFLVHELENGCFKVHRGLINLDMNKALSTEYKSEIKQYNSKSDEVIVPEVYIIIQARNIYKKVLFNNNILFTLGIIKTTVHELTHYKQFLNDENYNKNYISPEEDIVAYSKQFIEKEADKMGYLFIIKNIKLISKCLFNK